MSLVRINDLARELDVKSKSILDALPLVGVTEKKTHSSSIEEQEAEKVRAYLQRHGSATVPNTRNSSLGENEIKTRIDLSHISRPGEVLRAILQQQRTTAPPRAQSSSPGQTPASPSQPPSPRLIVPQTGARPVYKATAPRPSVVTVQSKEPSPPPFPSRSDAATALSAGATSALPFMQDEKLRQIAVRDYDELRKVAAVGAVKSRFILMGGLLEALLLDALLTCTREAAATRAAQREGTRKLDQWSLASLIDAAVDLDFVRPGVKNLSHQVRDFRNLIHPAFERRKRYDVRKDEADIAEQILTVVIKDLRDIFARNQKP